MNPNNTIYARSPRGFSSLTPRSPGLYAAWQKEGHWPCNGRIILVDVIAGDDGFLRGLAISNEALVDDPLVPDDGFQSDHDPWFESHWSEAIDLAALPSKLAPAPILGAGGQDISWIDCRRQMPPPPETSYEVYLVWAVQLTRRATGAPTLLQFSRDRGAWEPLPFGRAGVPQIVTHFSKALQVLGSPDPKPYGPRGDDYL